MKVKEIIIIFAFGSILFSCTNNADKNQHAPNLRKNTSIGMDKTRKRFTRLDNGEIIRYQQIAKDSANSIVQNQKVTAIESSDKNDSLYKLDDGRILLMQNYGGCYLYRNIGDINLLKKSTEDFYNKLAQNPDAENHLLSGIFQYTDNFPTYAPKLSKSLLADFGVRSQTVDINALKDIDNKILSTEDPVEIYRQHFAAIIAIVGEALVEKHHAQWCMQRSKKGDVWEPYLQIGERKVEFFNWLYEDIFINQDPEKPLLFESYQTIEDWLNYKSGKDMFL